jgi:hypothetical protein
MTEAEWLARTNPDPMLQFLRGRTCACRRKLRLFACACVRRVWRHLTDPRSRAAVEVAERYADGLATAKELARARQEAAWAAAWSCRRDAADSAVWVASDCSEPGWVEMATSRAYLAERTDEVFRLPQCSLLREIFGNPFVPVRAEPSWRTRKVLKLAGQAYEKRDFARLADLGELLERAGCADPEALEHCRQPGEHVRGCWLLDLLLRGR